MKGFGRIVPCVLGLLIAVPAARTSAQNLLRNPSFELVGPAGPHTIQAAVGQNGPSAAADWRVWQARLGPTVTSLVPSTLPGGGLCMLRVTTNGRHNGLYQIFATPVDNPPKVLSLVWVWVARGRVGVGTGDGSRTFVSQTSTTLGQWELLCTGNSVSPANETVIYAVSEEGADFFVEGCVTLEPHSGALAGLVESMGLHHGITRSLLAKLRAAREAEERGDVEAWRACLGAFRHEVAAQTGRLIPAGQAGVLLRIAAELEAAPLP